MRTASKAPEGPSDLEAHRWRTCESKAENCRRRRHRHRGGRFDIRGLEAILNGCAGPEGRNGTPPRANKDEHVVGADAENEVQNKRL